MAAGLSLGRLPLRAWAGDQAERTAFHRHPHDIARLGWADEIDQVVFRAFPPLNEVIFFHHRSRTVIFTDLMFNIVRYDSPVGSWLLRLDGGFRGLAVPRSFKPMLWIRRSECRGQFARVLSWDFDRVIIAHGDIVNRDGHRAVERAVSFLHPIQARPS
jgi:hypothetical protein